MTDNTYTHDNDDVEMNADAAVHESEPVTDVEYEEDMGAAGMKKLRDKNKQLVEENRQLLDSLQRMRADVVNRDKAAAEERGRVKEIVKEGMLEELLPVLDAFSAAMAGEAWQKVEPNWRAGVEYIYSQFVKVLSDNGIEQYGKVGDVYDPLVHDLVEEVTPSEGAKVVAVVRAGYKLSTRILRAAGVKVG